MKNSGKAGVFSAMLCVLISVFLWGQSPSKCDAGCGKEVGLSPSKCGIRGEKEVGLSPSHEALRREIEELRKRPAVCELPRYLSENEDFGEVCQKAGRKKILVSIGREECGRCQRFYELVRRGIVKIDANEFVFVRLNIDNMEQREYFMGTFEVPDIRLPFVGVTDGERSEMFPCLTGSPSVEEYQTLMDGRLR